jgi:O-antigen/teichoic acid export membrane protein
MKKLLLSSSTFTIFVMGINFLFKIYLSYKVTKEELGLFWTFLDLISIGIMFFSGFKDSLIVSHDRDDFRQILYWYIITFWSLFVLVLIGDLEYFDTLDFPYPIYYFMTLLFFNAVMIFVSYLNASYKNYKIMLFENLVMSIALVGSFFLLYDFFPFEKTLFISFCISYIVRTLYIIYLGKIEWNITKVSIVHAQDFFKNTFLSGGMYFFSGFFISMSGIILLNLFHDKTVLAEYQVVVRSIFFSLVAVFVFPLNTFTFPHLSKFIAEGNIDEIFRIEKKLVKYLFIFFIFLLFGTFLTKFIITLVFPKEYQESYIMLNILLPFLPFIAYTTFALNIIKGFNRFDLALYVRVLGTILFFISISIFYTLKMDAKSVVYSLDISFITMFLMALYFRRKVLL